jgi:hypothetical protein
MPDFRARCFWTKLRLRDNTPFRIAMPGIFNSIDGYTKAVIHDYLDQYARLPRYLDSIGGGDVRGDANNTRLSYDEPATQTRLTGCADDIFVARNSEHHLVDYKTAKHPAHRTNCSRSTTSSSTATPSWANARRRTNR